METRRLLCQAFLENHPREAAQFVERLSLGEEAALLEEVPPEVAAEVLRRMGLTTAAECLSRLAAPKAAAVVAALPLDSAAGLLRRVIDDDRQRLLAATAEETRVLLERLLHYPEGTAGALMDPTTPAFPQDITASEALMRVRRAPRHAHYYVYVIDRDQKVVGVLNLREIMLAPGKAPLSEVMHHPVAWLLAHADRAAIVAHPGWREFHALPVVDDASVFLGALRYETLRKLEHDHATSRPQESAMAALLSLGELCWAGMAGLLTDLTTNPISIKREGRRD
jgi:magnesium transporter